MHTKDRLTYESLEQIQTLYRGTWVYRELLICPHNFAVYVGMASCRNLYTVNTISKSSAPIFLVLRNSTGAPTLYRRYRYPEHDIREIL
ncbi:hypothetical protein AYI69_g2975 [Smittium culicis]|uniref:Uncharacterized protein n=1 Tax=Smittium culicis TaxID=133412 RepID=A0A1R1YL07_9FUNG|nr:hypothetical protein AYI69_g2975 [Smittium culicis]